jgi:hypothetical protein
MQGAALREGKFDTVQKERARLQFPLKECREALWRADCGMLDEREI